MILYNMRYRGPYEYEKTILNVFQYHNEILSLTKELKEENDENIKNISNKAKDLFQKLDAVSNKLLLIRERKTEI